MGKKKNRPAGNQSPGDPCATTPPAPATPAATESPQVVPKREARANKTKKPPSPLPSGHLAICRNKYVVARPRCAGAPHIPSRSAPCQDPLHIPVITAVVARLAYADLSHRHWRYIACFHGPWLQMPIEILETMASINYNTPRPHPIDPALLYDVIKIRKLVEEATDLAVRAASDLPSQGGSGGYGGGGSNLGLVGQGPSHGPRISRERKYRMMLQACQKLAHAYRIDEIACSVATMQGTSTVDEIGSTVLQRNNNEVDGKYVHFFHQKIPSRQLADHTSIRPLNEIILACPTDPEPYRTRAMIRSFMLDFGGAISDFSKALDRVPGDRHDAGPPPPASELSSMQHNGHANGKRPPDVRLRDEDQPSSLVPQLLFMRACARLAQACDTVRDTITLTDSEFSELPQSPFMKDPVAAASGFGSNLPRSHLLEQRPKLSEKEALESRKAVKTQARRALKDFLAFLSYFDYTPLMPPDALADFSEKIGQAASGNKNPRHVQPGKIAPEIVHHVSALFSATPPVDMPPYPPADADEDPGNTPSSEACTYHPLLTEALHSLLLCHYLLQTSKTELIRHAHNVARIARIADAYPVFQASRSAARADFVEVLEKTGLASSFSRPWDALCAPAPLPPIRHPSNCKCGQDHAENGNARGNNGRPFMRWSVSDDGKDYPIVTDRALLIMKWASEVPFVSMGTAKKKRRVVGRGKGEGRGGAAEGKEDEECEGL